MTGLLMSGENVVDKTFLTKPWTQDRCTQTLPIGNQLV